MVRDYCEKFYVTAYTRGEQLGANSMKRGIALAHAKDSLRHRWNSIKIVGVHTSGNGHFKVGQSMQVEAMVDLPGLTPEEVTVQLFAGPVNARGEIDQPQALNMALSKTMAPDRHMFVGKFDCRTSGRQGYAIRILPGSPDLATPFEPGLIVWN